MSIFSSNFQQDGKQVSQFCSIPLSADSADQQGHYTSHSHKADSLHLTESSTL